LDKAESAIDDVNGGEEVRFALHLPDVQHELLIHSIISGGTRVIIIFSNTVSIV